MGFYGKHCLDNGLQAKTADYKRILFLANQNLGRRFQTISFLSALYKVLTPFDRLPSRCSHRLFELNFHHFPPPPLQPASELFASLFISIVLVGGSFFPTFAEETFVYYILAVGRYWK